MNRLKCTTTLFGLFLFLSPVLAFDIPPSDGFVTDRAGIFLDSEESRIEAKIEAIQDATTAEIGVLTLPSTNGEDIAQLAFEVGNTWGVGKKENDNGLVILIAVDDRAWFMATGYGLEGALPDAIAKRIGEEVFPQFFRKGEYANGLMAALNDVEGYLKKDPSVVALYSIELPEDLASRTAKELISFIVLFFLIFAKMTWLIVIKKKKAQIKAALLANTIIVILALTFTSLVFVGILIGVSIFTDLLVIFGGGGKGSSGSSWSSGSSTSNSSAGSRSSSGSSSWGGSSGGSFGGGSFGGGGAGGRW